MSILLVGFEVFVKKRLEYHMACRKILECNLKLLLGLSVPSRIFRNVSSYFITFKLSCMLGPIMFISFNGSGGKFCFWMFVCVTSLVAWKMKHKSCTKCILFSGKTLILHSSGGIALMHVRFCEKTDWHIIQLLLYVELFDILNYWSYTGIP